MQTPGDRSHIEQHSRARLNQRHILLTRTDSQGTSPQTRLHADFTGATSGVCGHGGAFRPSRGASVGSRYSSHLTKARIANRSVPKGRSAVPRHRLLPNEKEVQGKPHSSGQGPLLSAPLALVDWPRARSGQAVSVSGRRVAAWQPGAGVPPAVPPSLLPSPRHHRHQMAKRRSPRRERCAAAGGTGAAAPPPRRATGARPGPRPPSLALTRPGRGCGGSRAGHAQLRPLSR